MGNIIKFLAYLLLLAALIVAALIFYFGFEDCQSFFVQRVPGVCEPVPPGKVAVLVEEQQAVDRLFAEEARTDLPPPRHCRGDSFFIEVPLTARPRWSSNAFLPGVERDLQTRARGEATSWFCSAEHPESCPNPFGVQFEIAPLLPKDGYHPLREDGHLRFYRARFADGNGKPLQVNDAAECEVVSAVRAHFLARAINGVKGDDFRPQVLKKALGDFPSDAIRVGRECDASALSPELFKPNRMNWYLDMLNIDRKGGAALEGVDIALIDTGLDDNTAKALGISPANIEAPGAISPVVGVKKDLGHLAGKFHKHAAIMARLLSKVSPASKITSYRAMDVFGFGTTEGLAKTLDLAIKGAVESKGRPRVINLSLGWSPTKGRDVEIEGRNYDGTTCRTVEHGVGESVRYLLAIAHMLDSAPDNPTPITVVSAAGNRPELPLDTDPKALQFINWLPRTVVKRDLEDILRSPKGTSPLEVLEKAVEQVKKAVQRPNGKTKRIVRLEDGLDHDEYGVPTAQPGTYYQGNIAVRDPDGRLAGAFEIVDGALPAGLRLIDAKRELPDGVLERMITGKLAADSKSSKFTVRFTETEGPRRTIEKTFFIRVVGSDACVEPPAAVDWFYPARWEAQLTCLQPTGKPVPLSWAVGAIDRRLFPGALTQRNPEPPLLSPGEFVYAALPTEGPADFKAAPEIPNPSRYEPNFDFPKFVSGTSASAALVSAMVAQAQATLLANKQPAMTSWAMRTAVARSSRTIRNSYVPYWSTLQKTVLNRGSTVPVPPIQAIRVESNYKIQLAPGQQQQQQLSVTRVPASLTRNYLEEMNGFGLLPGGPDQAELGTVGPMPTSPSCTVCEQGMNSPEVRLELDLNPELAGVKISNPVVFVDHRNGRREVVELEYNPAEWVAGNHVQTVLHGDWSDTESIKLSLGVTLTDDSEATLDISALERQDKPRQ